jgi:hypothetical protein
MGEADGERAIPHFTYLGAEEDMYWREDPARRDVTLPSPGPLKVIPQLRRRLNPSQLHGTYRSGRLRNRG